MCYTTNTPYRSPDSIPRRTCCWKKFSCDANTPEQKCWDRAAERERQVSWEDVDRGMVPLLLGLAIERTNSDLRGGNTLLSPGLALARLSYFSCVLCLCTLYDLRCLRPRLCDMSSDGRYGKHHILYIFVSPCPE